mmetsp:Transcript_46578/g.93361  ORF Transcript_46578/g.93361 Transcript_46578/m.93361 type:complete len:100 (-) Transcript_46578:84-383(-)
MVCERTETGSGHGFRILASLLEEADEVIVALVTTHNELPPLPDVCAAHRVFARRYRQSRHQLLQGVLYCVSLTNRLRQLARQNQDKVHVMDAHVLHNDH